jgi:hypothetical protein
MWFFVDACTVLCVRRYVRFFREINAGLQPEKDDSCMVPVCQPKEDDSCSAPVCQPTEDDSCSAPVCQPKEDDSSSAPVHVSARGG